MLQRLPIVLAQVKAGIISQNLLYYIKFIYLVYNNIMKPIQL